MNVVMQPVGQCFIHIAGQFAHKNKDRIGRQMIAAGIRKMGFRYYHFQYLPY